MHYPKKNSARGAQCAAAPHDGAQLKKITHHFPLFYFFNNGERSPRQRESIYSRRGAPRDDDNSAVLPTAVTSPEAEGYGVKKKNDAALFGHGLETDRPARTFQADTPLSGARSAK